MQQIESFGKCVDEFRVFSSVLAEIDLRLLPTRIAVVLAVVQEVVTRLVVVLVSQRNAELIGKFPTVIVVAVSWMRAWSDGSHDNYFGMGFRDALVHILKALAKFRRNAFFIAQAKIFQMERFRMSLLGTLLAPSCGYVSISPFNEVERVLRPLVHIFHRCHILCLSRHTPAAICALARYAARKDGNRLHPKVFTKLEVFVVTESHRLMVAPSILEMFALMTRSDGCLPTISAPEPVATSVHDTASRKAHELGLQVGKRLNQVLAKAVTLVGVLRHERNLIDIDGSFT